MDTEGASFRDNVHAFIMPRRPIIKRRHVFFVLEARQQGGPLSISRPAISRARAQGGPGPFP